MAYSAKNTDEHLLYRTYWKLCLSDVISKNGWMKEAEITSEAKEQVHDFHKRVLGYKTISGLSHEKLSKFIQEVCLFWAETSGVFIRTSKKQPKWIEWMPLSEVRHLL